jgi:hypothetical protein
MPMERYCRRSTVRDLLDRTIPQTLADMQVDAAEWQVKPALFARVGATEGAQAELIGRGGVLVDLPRLATELAEP